jgi:hypothetical protein
MTSQMRQPRGSAGVTLMTRRKPPSCPSPPVDGSSGSQSCHKQSVFVRGNIVGPKYGMSYNGACSKGKEGNGGGHVK